MTTTTTAIVIGVVLVLLAVLAAWLIRRRAARAATAAYSTEVTERMTTGRLARDAAARVREVDDAEIERRTREARDRYDDDIERDRLAGTTDPGIPPVGELGGGFYDPASRRRYPTRNASRVDDPVDSGRAYVAPHLLDPTHPASPYHPGYVAPEQDYREAPLGEPAQTYDGHGAPISSPAPAPAPDPTPSTGASSGGWSGSSDGGSSSSGSSGSSNGSSYGGSDSGSSSSSSSGGGGGE
jgi:uncharacterized membrane protein YgcG